MQASGDGYVADIGGDYGGSAGNITINGGVVDAFGTASVTGIGNGSGCFTKLFSNADGEELMSSLKEYLDENQL